jgi:hypothetical protein
MLLTFREKLMLFGPIHFEDKKLTGEVAKKYIQESQICFQVVFLQLFFGQNVK